MRNNINAFIAQTGFVNYFISVQMQMKINEFEMKWLDLALVGRSGGPGFGREPRWCAVVRRSSFVNVAVRQGRGSGGNLPPAPTTAATPRFRQPSQNGLSQK